MAIMSMTQATAEERIRRAQHSKTRTSTRNVKIEPGEIVEFWREPENEESSGWRGPGKLVYIDNETGTCTLSFKAEFLFAEYKM